MPLGCMGTLVCSERFAFDVGFSETLSGLGLPWRAAINTSEGSGWNNSPEIKQRKENMQTEIWLFFFLLNYEYVPALIYRFRFYVSREIRV